MADLGENLADLGLVSLVLVAIRGRLLHLSFDFGPNGASWAQLALALGLAWLVVDEAHRHWWRHQQAKQLMESFKRE